jgi:hypothetical protein
MPANLNALIRYKAIDLRLRNKFSPCTIGNLQDVCSEALGEFRGIYKKVSERTIRDDIRVMRSEMLGFNAPIVCEGGFYSYSDSNYSIFSVSIRDLDLLKQVMLILIENRARLRDNGVDEIIRELRMLTVDTSYADYAQEPVRKRTQSLSHYIDLEENAISSEEPARVFRKQSSEPKKFSRFIKWIRLRRKVKEGYEDLLIRPPRTETDTIHFSISSLRTSFGWGEILKLVG